MAETDFRFTVDVKGVSRTILSVGETKSERDSNGRVTIRFKPASHFRRTASWVGDYPRDGQRIRSQKYSVHPTNRNPDGNLIHLTIEMEGGPPVEKHHWTEAIKKQNNFAMLHIWRLPDMSRDDYISTSGGAKNIGIGSYRPKSYTLITYLLVGPPERDFQPIGTFLNCKHVELSRLRVTLLWNYLAFPSLDNGALIPMETTKDTSGLNEEGRRAQDGIIAGLSELDCYVNAAFLLAHLMDERGSLRLRDRSPAPEGSLPFSRSGAVFEPAKLDFIRQPKER